MKHKWLITLCILVILPLILAGAFLTYLKWAFNTSFQPSEIAEGFSLELLEVLQNRYGITIPEDAQFIKGYNLPGWRDSYMAVLFELPITGTYKSGYHMSDYIRQRLNLGTRYPGPGKDAKQFFGSAWYDELGGQMEWMLKDSSTGCSYISYNIESDKLVIRFIGWRPGAIFR